MCHYSPQFFSVAETMGNRKNKELQAWPAERMIDDLEVRARIVDIEAEVMLQRIHHEEGNPHDVALEIRERGDGMHCNQHQYN